MLPFSDCKEYGSLFENRAFSKQGLSQKSQAKKVWDLDIIIKQLFCIQH